ncbi:MAG: hypothetical protein SGI73_09745 [Chloroflexota bacterium]|nr:hypothetical protein [Chloroflexota bacterium]
MLENNVAPVLSLNGDWEIEIGGVTATIRVPGAWEAQGYPADVETAVYRREIDVPDEWAGARIMLRCHAVSYHVECIVNGESIGRHEGIWTAFELDATAALRVGARNTLELRIRKPSPHEIPRWGYRETLVGFIPYVSTTFGGVWQDIELVAQHGEMSSDLRASSAMPQQDRMMLRADGATLRLNGEPIHLRGILSWGWNPATLAPTPTDAEIRAEFERVRALGFNLYKLCLYVPPQNLFDIADEMGMLLWLELPLWWQRMTPHLRAQVLTEYADIFAAVKRHPSIVIVSLGCELDASMADGELLGQLNDMARGAFPGALICDNSGSGEAYKGLAFDYADFNDYHFYADLHYFSPLCDHFRRDWRPERPTIFGEFCDCDDFRAPDDIDFARARLDLLGVEGNTDRWAYSEQVQRMTAARASIGGLPFSDAQIRDVSRKQSCLFRKTILEKTRARTGMAGYVITGLRDTPISTSGIFDDNDQPKFDADAFKMFNADTVLLLEQGRGRRWTNGGDRPAPFDLYNHTAGETVSLRIVGSGLKPLNGQLTWRLTDSDGREYAGGAADVAMRAALDLLTPLEFVAPEVERAGAWTLAAELIDTDSGILARNEWTLWLYPRATFPSDGVVLYDPAGALADLAAHFPRGVADLRTVKLVIASVFDQAVETHLREGGRALIIQSGDGLLPTTGVPFWRESVKFLFDHPAWGDFPHDGYPDLQFYHLATDRALDLVALSARFPAAHDFKPIMRRLDARLFTLTDYAVEFGYGAGRAIATTLRFFGGAGDQVIDLEDNIAGQYCLHQLIDFLNMGNLTIPLNL